jgi:hypothetical protein
VPPTPTPIPPPPAPALTAPDDGNIFPEGASIDLNWTAAGPGVEYFTEVDGGPSGAGSFGPQGSSFQEIGPLPAGYDYTWRVRARGPGGDSPWSEPRDFSVRLATPTEIQTTALSCTEVRLTWRDNSENEDGYLVYRDGALVGQTGASETAFLARDLAGGADHPFAVRAYRATHESASSSVATTATPPCDTTPPSGNWLSPTGGATIRQDTVLLEATADDNGSGIDRVIFRGRWNGAWRDLASLTAPPFRHNWDLCQAGVPDGPLDLRLHIVDHADNETVQAIGVVKRVNCAPNQPPDTPRIASPDEGSRVVGDAPIAVVVSDSYDTPQELRVEVRIDNGGWTDTTYDIQSGRHVAAWNTNGNPDGLHTVRARATDSGDSTSIADPVEVVVDNIDEPPAADAGPDQTIFDTDESGAESVTLDAEASTHDPQRTATFAWKDRWDNRPPVSLGSGKRLTSNLPVGTHVITMVVTDSLGNQDDDEVVIAVSPPPDTIAPTAAWSTPTAGAIIDERTLTLGATVSDTGGSGLKEIVFRARWGGEWHTLATIRHAHSPVGYRWDVCADDVPNGNVELAIRAIDNAGNQFDAPTRTVTKRFACAPADPRLDLSPPEAARGDAVQITASGFASGETITASLVQEQKPKTKNKKKNGKKGKKGKRGKRPQQPRRVLTLESASATAEGTAILTFTVPEDAPLGRHRLDVVGSEGTRASATFAVLPAAPRTAAVERASSQSDAPDSLNGNGASPGNADPSAPAGNGPEPALLPPEGSSLAAAPSKRKPGKSRDRAGRDDNDNDKQKAKHKTKQARIDERRSKRQPRD